MSVGLARRVALRRSASATGRLIDSPPPGFGVPLELAAVEPRTYAPLLPAGARAAVSGLGRGEALLTRTSARLRRLGRGGRIRLAEDRSLRVIGVIDDGLVRRAEIVVNVREGARLDAQRRWVLVPHTGEPERLVAALQDAGGPELRVRDLGRAPWPSFLRILPQATLKERFGEFAVRLDRGDEVVVEPSWVERNIVGATVPILGTVSCHREMIPALRRAMAELERRGLERLVDRGDYAGCFAAKDIPTTGAVSRHAWGLAIDLNAAANPYGERSTQDRRLVEVMERNGFAWGGRWPTPDAMHFEYVGEGLGAGA
ncbi:MAG: M15 family metallopeptidase [Thermoleophilaceae bacterium]|nr:M15 family metallopeptidase [Thermoleophilaceae bacterium]